MTDLLLAAQAAPSTQPISLLQLVIGLVMVILAVAGIAWKAGRAVATKDDLATLKGENEKAHAGITENVMENRRRIDGIGESVHSIDRNLAFLSGRQHEQDQTRRTAGHPSAEGDSLSTSPFGPS